MNGKRFAFLSTLTTAFTVVALAPQPAAGQDRAGGTETPSTAAASPWTVPRTPDGQPDLQGVWVNTSATPFERPQAPSKGDSFSPTTKWPNCHGGRIGSSRKMTRTLPSETRCF